MNAFKAARLYLAYQRAVDNWKAYRKGNPMLTLSQVLKSRAVWTLVAAALFNGVNSITPQIHDPHIVAAINGALVILAAAFRIAPNQHVGQ